MNRRRLVSTLAAGAFATGTAHIAGAQTPETGGTREITDVRGTQAIPANPQAIVCLG